MTDDNQDQIEELKQVISQAESSLEEAKKALAALTGEDVSSFSAKPSKANPPMGTASGNIIEGIFDGEGMLGPDGKIYPVPANYASKSKLIEGDRLKLTIAEDGSFIYKQIGPAERKKIIGELNYENNVYSVLAEGKTYHVLYASVTYFKAKPGDRVTIVVPATEDCKWAAIENIIHDVPKEAPAEDPDDVLDLREEIKGSGFLEPEVPAVDGAAPIEQVAEVAPQINSAPVEEVPMDKPAEEQAVAGLPEFPDFEEAKPETNNISAMTGSIPSPDEVFGSKDQPAPTEVPQPTNVQGQPSIQTNEIEI
jgi:hypothetical protein